MAEVLATMAILSAVLMYSMQLMYVIFRQGRTVEAQRMAWLEAGNLMEYVMARPWEDMQPGALASLTLSDACRQALPGAILRVDVRPDDLDPTVLRISIEIQWPDDASRLAAPVRLVAWRYPPLEATS